MNFKQFFFLRESEVSYETAKKIYKSLPKKEQELLSHYFLEGENKKLEAAANAWADKMMNEEKYRLKVQQSAINNAIGTATLPKNLKT